MALSRGHLDPVDPQCVGKSPGHWRISTVDVRVLQCAATALQLYAGLSR